MVLRDGEKHQIHSSDEAVSRYNSIMTQYHDTTPKIEETYDDFYIHYNYQVRILMNTHHDDNAFAIRTCVYRET